MPKKKILIVCDKKTMPIHYELFKELVGESIEGELRNKGYCKLVTNTHSFVFVDSYLHIAKCGRQDQVLICDPTIPKEYMNEVIVPIDQSRLGLGQYGHLRENNNDRN